MSVLAPGWRLWQIVIVAALIGAAWGLARLADPRLGAWLRARGLAQAAPARGRGAAPPAAADRLRRPGLGRRPGDARADLALALPHRRARGADRHRLARHLAGRADRAQPPAAAPRRHGARRLGGGVDPGPLRGGGGRARGRRHRHGRDAALRARPADGAGRHGRADRRRGAAVAPGLRARAPLARPVALDARADRQADAARASRAARCPWGSRPSAWI